MDKDKNITNLLTQSAVIDYLAKHVDQLGPAIQKSLKELNFEKKAVISIDHGKPAIEAFKLMAENVCVATTEMQYWPLLAYQWIGSPW